MKLLITSLLMCYVIVTGAQEITAENWEELAKDDIRLLPKYGHQEKTAEQKKTDHVFITKVMSLEQFHGDSLAVSNHLIDLGFKYMYQGDSKTAMYRFNQAYLIKPDNPEIYWGFGGFFMNIGLFEKAGEQYREGLAISPANTHLLTDYATLFMQKSYNTPSKEKETSLDLVDSAITYLNTSYRIDSVDVNTLYKLSICHWMEGNCEEAWQYYEECQAQGGRPITEGYTADLEKRCKRKNKKDE